MRFTGAIFDMDGVLFDTERIYQQAWHEIAAERGIELKRDFLKAVSGTNGMYLLQIIEQYYHVQDGTKIIEMCMGKVRDKLSDHVPLKEGVLDLLKYFKKKGISMAVASSSARQQIEANLEKTNIRGYFADIVSGAEVKHGKPAPDIFLSAAARIGSEPEKCFVFEDSENGVRAGFAAGCGVIMVPDLIEASQEIQPYCIRICQNLTEAEKEIDAML